MHGQNNTTAAANPAAHETPATAPASEQEQLAQVIDAIRELRSMVKAATYMTRRTPGRQAKS